MVIRNQALESEYPGRHKSYIRKYGGEYNDEMKLNSFMAPEFDEEIEDYTPFKTGASWLSGYCK